MVSLDETASSETIAPSGSSAATACPTTAGVSCRPVGTGGRSRSTSAAPGSAALFGQRFERRLPILVRRGQLVIHAVFGRN